MSSAVKSVTGIAKSFLGGGESEAAEEQRKAIGAAQTLSAEQSKIARGDINLAAQGARSDIDIGTTAARRDLFLGAGLARGEVQRGDVLQREALDPFLAASGALGGERQAQSFQEFTESPEQAFLREQGERSILRNQAAIGGLGGGNVRRELQRQGIGLAAQDFQNRVARLQAGTGALAGVRGTTSANLANLFSARGTGLSGLRASAAINRAGLRQFQGAGLANIALGQGVQQANLALAGGEAQAAGERARSGLIQTGVSVLGGLFS